MGKVVKIGGGGNEVRFEVYDGNSFSVRYPGSDIPHPYCAEDLEKLRTALSVSPNAIEPTEYYVRPRNFLFEVCRNTETPARPITTTRIVSASSSEEDAKSIAKALNEAEGL